ncbi:MAG: tRNA (adenosine(37)-N6)-threonylcarbamoyltransferase complex dimerization subunit type 1 TsaB, partial [Paracoccaceae bacterium]|nr:tRNA (adenosine(37)-N6)-threonylcarbamoyltransferase complex dimerization subunit type 1 TsaB [Paracoccaceae bacterium]
PQKQPHMLIAATARIAASRLATNHARPAPLYIRSADAAPPRDPAPVLLP